MSRHANFIPSRDDPVRRPSDPELQALRERLETWLDDFEREFERVGGDPRVENPYPRDFLDDYTVVRLLECASRAAWLSGDADKAVERQLLALRVECWRGQFGGEDDLGVPLLCLRDLFEAGALSEVRDESILRRLLAWSIPSEYFDGRFAKWYESDLMSLEIDYGLRWKPNRTRRRYAELVRELRRDLFLAKPYPEVESSLLVSWWIDPVGDRWLEGAVSDFVCSRRHYLREDWLELEILKVAIAAELHEREHGAWPVAIEDLVPELLPFAPVVPWDSTNPIRIDGPGRAVRYSSVEMGEWHDLVIPSASSER